MPLQASKLYLSSEFGNKSFIFWKPRLCLFNIKQTPKRPKIKMLTYIQFYLDMSCCNIRLILIEHSTYSVTLDNRIWYSRPLNRLSQAQLLFPLIYSLCLNTRNRALKPNNPPLTLALLGKCLFHPASFLVVLKPARLLLVDRDAVHSSTITLYASNQ